MKFSRSCSVVSVLGGCSLAWAHGAEFGADVPASCSTIPDDFQLVNQTYVLPDPFTFINGSAVKTAADWDCRAAQTRELFQKYELGYKPAKPAVFNSTYDSKTGTLEIVTGTSADKTVNFSVPITAAKTASTGSTGSPAIIVYDAASIPIPSQVATITLNIDDIAQQNSDASRGVGVFYDLYGAPDNTTAGALMAWAWAVSRVIDALEDQQATTGIDATKVGVTGCSRNGKGALVAGAFDERVALTVPQESGSGGDACWRVSRDMLVNQGLATQTAWEIINEDPWFAESFDAFCADNYTVGLLPEDHHQLAGLVAPRGLYSTENVGFLWLGDQSNWECMSAANKVYQALGAATSQGFSQDGPHDHCSFPDDQADEIAAFFDRFLLGQNVTTDVFRTVGNYTLDPSWTPWTVPSLTS
ncbi:putative extracelular cellulose binding protein [Xylariaceae sp. FL0804]|nr:putative extracelular cellulose binding protein [Xylariaceae sp. FL0804]